MLDAKIWTGDPAQPEAEAVAIWQNRIVAVGSSEIVGRLKGSHTALLRMEGRRIVPGFNDAHVHLLSGGRNLAGPQLRQSRSVAELSSILAGYARGRRESEWITGGNWDHENWSPSRLPTHTDIDAAASGHPVFIKRLDGHMALANAEAMRLAGVNQSTADVAGGVIVRNAQGEPTGIFKDAAMDLIYRVIPPLTNGQMQEAVRAAQTYANAQGVTSVQDMSLTPELFRVYQQMARNGELRLRISGHQPLREWRRLAGPGIQAGFGNELLRVGGLKGFADGSLGSTTALLSEPYLDAPNTKGLASDELTHRDEMLRNILDADRAGLQIAIHAIGDYANQIILGFYGELALRNGTRDRRPRIEHAQHLRPEDIQRFHDLGVVASMQPVHLADDGRWAEKRIGPERAKTAYAFRSLLDTGAVLAFGSDWDVAPMTPILGIAAAVTRATTDGKHPNGWIPEQKITVADALRAYTYGSAYASLQEQWKGKIAPGMLADMAVLSDDILTIPPSKIADTRVISTIFSGQVIPVDKSSLHESLPTELLLRP